MTAFRRVVSILAYVIAGMFLMTWATMAFVSGERAGDKAMAMGIMAVLALVPLAVAALVSPGRRVRETGIVLMIASGSVALSGLFITILVMDPQFMAFMPPDTPQALTMVGDVVFGVAITVGMGAGGWWLVRRTDKAGSAGISEAGTD